METAPQKAARAKLPISDNMLVAISTRSTLASDSFPRTTDAWEEKNNVEKMWSEWKDTYLADHESRENSLRSAGKAGGHNFGTANSATTPTSDHRVTFQEHNRPPTIPNETLDSLHSYLLNMLDAVANASTDRSLDAADISRMAKILKTLTINNATLVK